jgi:uncharacterized protein (DUF1800 family)
VLDTSSATPHWVGVPDLSESRGWYETYLDMTWFWLERCRLSHAPLVEKMVLFWHGHLCSSMDKVYQRQWMFDQNQVFRTHGLGNFEDLVQAVSVQPAMLNYLDNDRNAAGAPNENFARELMELFTLGIGNYSEDDVRASARAWTGHGIGEAGGYDFNPWAHDWDPKTFFGDTRNWDGPQIIDHIVNGPKQAVVARFIASKLWSFLAYPNPESGVLDQIAPVFANSGMEIRPLVRAILLHPQFRSQQAKLGLIRSPIDYVVHTMRITGLGCDEAHPEWSLRPMGQEPFLPPNVAGWKQNQYWVNAAAVWAKANFASNVRWRLFERHELGGSSSKTAVEAADAALARFGITNPSATSRNALIGYVEHERANTNWAEQAGLLMLPMLTPEFQLA